MSRTPLLTAATIFVFAMLMADCKCFAAMQVALDLESTLESATSSTCSTPADEPSTPVFQMGEDDSLTNSFEGVDNVNQFALLGSLSAVARDSCRIQVEMFRGRPVSSGQPPDHVPEFSYSRNKEAEDFSYV